MNCKLRISSPIMPCHSFHQAGTAKRGEGYRETIVVERAENIDLDTAQRVNTAEDIGV